MRIGFGSRARRKRPGGYSGGTPAPDFTAPTLAVTDDEVNPPLFSVYSGGINGSATGDTWRLIWADNSGFTDSDFLELVYDSDELLLGGVDWEAEGFGPFTPDDTIYWKLEVYRSAALLGTSNTISALIPIPDVVALGYTVTATPANRSLGFGSSSETFTAMDIGAPDPDRYIEIIAGKDQDEPFNGCTIQGITATLTGTQPDRGLARYIAHVPTGTTADIVITAAGAYNKMGIVVARLIAAEDVPAAYSKVDLNGDDNPRQVTVTVPTDGIAVPAWVFWNGTNTPVLTNASSLAVNQGEGITIVVGLNELDGSQAMSCAGFAFVGGAYSAAAWSA